MDDEGRRCYEDFKVLLTEERKKVAKLEGWLKYLWDNYLAMCYRSSSVELEISDYIKAMEAKE